MPEVELVNIAKRFGKVTASADINLKVGYIRGDLASQQVADTYQGLIDTIAEYIESGRFEIIVDDTATWRSADAMLKTEDWIQAYPELNSIVCQNDEMAIGAIQAMKAAGIDMATVQVGGVDATQDALAAMQAGDLDVTVFQNAAAQGGGALDAAVKLAKGEAVDQKVYVPFELVTPANVADYASKN